MSKRLGGIIDCEDKTSSWHLIWSSDGMLFLTFSLLVAKPKKLLYTVGNPARALLKGEKRTNDKV